MLHAQRYHAKRNCFATGLAMDPSVVSSSLSSASGVDVTALNASSSNSNGAQLTNYSLTTAPVDNHRSVLSGGLQSQVKLMQQTCLTAFCRLLLQHPCLCAAV